MDHLQAFVKLHEYAIDGINESRLYMNDLNFQAEIGIQGFRTFTVDKPSSYKGEKGQCKKIHSSSNTSQGNSSNN